MSEQTENNFERSIEELTDLLTEHNIPFTRDALGLTIDFESVDEETLTHFHNIIAALPDPDYD